MDNDMYLHMNNSLYYHLFDSIVNSYLIDNCGRDPTSSAQIGLVVHSHCDYFSPTGFPAVYDLGLRVNKLGKSSVTYEIGVFERGSEEPKAVGEFIHVFVERQGMKPGKSGMEEEVRKGLEKLVVDEKSRL
jgi:acyl-CoA thioester hydrolase